MNNIFKKKVNQFDVRGQNKEVVEVMYDDDDYPIFVISIDNISLDNTKNTRLDITVSEVSSFTPSSRDIPTDLDFYLGVLIKWDGCMHFWFGDGGYLHLDAQSMKDHKKLIDRLIELANKHMEMFDE